MTENQYHHHAEQMEATRKEFNEWFQKHATTRANDPHEHYCWLAWVEAKKEKWKC